MRKLFFIGLALFSTLFVSAQSRLSAKAGINTLTLNSSDKDRDFSNRHTGIQLGLAYEVPLAGAFSIRPEFIVSQYAVSESAGGNKLKLGYYQIPVILNYRNEESGFNLFAGPQVGSISNAKYVNMNSDVTSGRGNTLNETDFGYTYGVSSTPNAKGYYLDVRAYRGLSNVLKTVYDKGVNSSNFALSVSIGYRFK